MAADAKLQGAVELRLLKVASLKVAVLKVAAYAKFQGVTRVAKLCLLKVAEISRGRGAKFFLSY